MGFILGGLDSESYDRTYSDRELIARIAGYFRAEWRRMAVVAADGRRRDHDHTQHRL